MKELVIITCILSATFHAGAETRKAAGLPAGQCTWYAYLRAEEAGWHIRFDKPYDRHARLWWDKITNARKAAEPAERAVMVLDAWEGNPYGHVAYVEQVISSNRWIVTHANFRLGTVAKEVGGKTIYRAVCERSSGGIRFQGSTQTFALRGFLHPGESK